MNRTIDFRWPRKLTAADKIKVERYPEVKFLYRKCRSLKKFFKDRKKSITSSKGTPIYDEYQKVCLAYHNTKRRCEEAILREIKARYKKEQPVIDIQRQLENLSTVESKEMKAENYIFVERVRAIDALFTFTTSSLKAECQRRVAAIDALTTLCQLQEDKGFRRRKAASNTKLGEESTPTSMSESSLFSDFITIECQPTQCIFCLGTESLPAEKRLWYFSSRADLKRHFIRKHLRHYVDNQAIVCPHPLCEETLKNKMYLQNHAEVVHKTPT